VAELVVALDLPTAADAFDVVARIGDAVAWYKVGPVLHVVEGAAVVRGLNERGKRVFLDLKWHDIPHTVAGAVAAAGAQHVALATVHLSGGAAMLEAAAAARTAGLRLLGVGVLTSLDAPAFGGVVGRPVQDIGEEQRRLVRLGAAAGLDGYVAAAPEVPIVRAVAGRGALLVVPGIRRRGDAAADQRRTTTPAEAVAAGADFLVVGRPITAARDPRGEALAFAAEMAS
jgi:orotidine-5'-phosphate decarboxylase